MQLSMRKVPSGASSLPLVNVLVVWRPVPSLVAFANRPPCAPERPARAVPPADVLLWRWWA